MSLSADKALHCATNLFKLNILAADTEPEMIKKPYRPNKNIPTTIYHS